MLIFRTTFDIVHKIKYFLKSKFDMKDMGEANVILGVKIIKNDNGIMLSQEHYVKKLLKKFGNFDVTTVRPPYDANTQLKKN